jgi:hypothetical protein
MVHFVLVGRFAHLDHQNLDFKRFGIARKNGSNRFGIRIGQRFGRHILAAIGIPLDIGETNPSPAQIFELTVLANPCKCNAIVNFRNLAQRRTRILGGE